jgi:hypothetical protein
MLMGRVVEHQHVFHVKVAIGFYAQDGRNMVVPAMLARYQTDHAVKHKWHVNRAERCGQHVTA